MEKVLGTLEMVLKERKKKKWCFFLSYTKAKAGNAQVRNGLGHGNVTHTSYIFAKIPTVRSWKIVF